MQAASTDEGGNVTNLTDGVTWNGQAASSTQFQQHYYELATRYKTLALTSRLQGRASTTIDPVYLDTQTGNVVIQPYASPGTYQLETLLCLNQSTQSLLERSWL
jgi:hypothetical protein